MTYAAPDIAEDRYGPVVAIRDDDDPEAPEDEPDRDEEEEEAVAIVINLLALYLNALQSQMAYASTLEQLLAMATMVSPNAIGQAGFATDLTSGIFGLTLPEIASAQYQALTGEAYSGDWQETIDGLVSEMGQTRPNGAVSILEAMNQRTRAEALAMLNMALTEAADLDGVSAAERTRYARWRFSEMYKARMGTRSVTIARTETTRAIARAVEQATIAAAEDLGGTAELVWRNPLDGRERRTHRIADSTTRIATPGRPDPTPDAEDAGDEWFIVGGFACLHPVDPRLPARESVNCRCWLVGRVIDIPDEDDTRAFGVPLYTLASPTPVHA